MKPADSTAPTGRPPGVFASFFEGVGILIGGFRLWGTSPKRMLLGMVPAAIVGVVFVALLVVLGLNAAAIVDWATPFADTWDEPYRSSVRVAAAVALIAVAVVVMLYAYAAVTLLVGDPFYERIWADVERSLGDAPAESGESAWRGLLTGIGRSLGLLLLTIPTAAVLFLLGFIPIIGQTVVPVAGVVVSGWFLTLELTGYAFDARGLSVRERRRLLARRRSRTLGFGTAVAVLFLVPVLSVLVMPAAVSGATVLARRALAEADGPLSARA
ncbi:EI24 domain-containing protein [Plantibacter sp. VKM Ac-2880]|uniref:EI24 domain-containing protein n=1 Tax=Plantibacter sp. VKM Ac-2880 TaxID=2783827 RepID=UPI00188FC06C|nr:EI24 domain-containing protein [Plantibacter sp. VKM Ac-2880]